MGGRRLTRDEKIRISGEHRKGLSNRAIAVLLKDKDGNGPDQSTIARIVRQLPQSQLDDLFEWNRLDLSDAPWEAGEWLLECQFSLVHYGGSESLLSTVEKKSVGRELFTNRWARWCWRVHLADHNLDVAEVVEIAHFYSYADQVKEILPDETQLETQWLDAILLFRPYSSNVNFAAYQRAVLAGEVDSPEDLMDSLDNLDAISHVSGGDYSGFIDNYVSMLHWMRTRFLQRRRDQCAAH